MGGPEFFLGVLFWGIPLALAVFVARSLWRMTKSVKEIEHDLSAIREQVGPRNPSQ